MNKFEYLSLFFTKIKFSFFMLIYISLSIACISLVLITLIYFKSKANNSNDISIQNLITLIEKLDNNLKNELILNRTEYNHIAKENRIELANQINTFSNNTFLQLKSFQENIDNNNRENRKELSENLEKLKLELSNALKDYRTHLVQQFGDFQNQQKTQSENTVNQLKDIRITLENNVKNMQEGNEKKLEEMRKTVDEKLNETLENRLGESFKQVSDRLEAVHKGLGEMQHLANSVGDLKKVMNNVKSRGIMGEYQLQNIIEDLLTNEQYEKNVKTKVGSGAVVEFAIKMPNGNNLDKSLWLPIDSKFPKEDYEQLVEAYDNGDIEKIEEYRKAFIKGIRKNAQDIKEKYIDPPNTTEYGIMFLPYESLFGEVLRTPGLFEQLQKEYKITITGPTTLSALLNSLQMGFRTLAIEKRSSEVWDLLGAVKTEFGKFGDVLVKTKKKLQEASNVIESAEVRTRAIDRQLKNVQSLTYEKSNEILGIEDELDDEN